MDREILIEYLDLLVKQEEDMKPYTKLCDELTVLDTIYITNQFIEKIIGIEETLGEFISKIIHELARNRDVELHYEDGSVVIITDTIELADFILNEE